MRWEERGKEGRDTRAVTCAGWPDMGGQASKASAQVGGKCRGAGPFPSVMAILKHVGSEVGRLMRIQK